MTKRLVADDLEAYGFDVLVRYNGTIQAYKKVDDMEMFALLADDGLRVDVYNDGVPVGQCLSLMRGVSFGKGVMFFHSCVNPQRTLKVDLETLAAEDVVCEDSPTTKGNDKRGKML